MAVLLRGATDNLLDLRIAGPTRDGTTNSVRDSDYSIYLVVSIDWQLPQETPEIFVPLSKSDHLSVKRASVVLSRRAIALEMQADRLGVDLLLTVLTAPGGIQGIEHFSASRLSVPIDARAFRPEFAWARVFVRRDDFDRACVGIQNVTEYPIVLTEIATLSRQRRPAIELRPFATGWECFGDEPFDVQAARFGKSRLRAVPYELLNVYLRTNPKVEIDR